MGNAFCIWLTFFSPYLFWPDTVLAACRATSLPLRLIDMVYCGQIVDRTEIKQLFWYVNKVLERMSPTGRKMVSHDVDAFQVSLGFPQDIFTVANQC